MNEHWCFSRILDILNCRLIVFIFFSYLNYRKRAMLAMLWLACMILMTIQTGRNFWTNCCASWKRKAVRSQHARPYRKIRWTCSGCTCWFVIAEVLLRSQRTRLGRMWPHRWASEPRPAPPTHYGNITPRTFSRGNVNSIEAVSIPGPSLIK